MSVTTDHEAVSAAERHAGSGHRHRTGRLWLIGAAVLVLPLAVAGIAAARGAFRDQGSTGHGSSGSAAATSTATLTRRRLSATTPVSGTLGYAGSYSVLGQLQGTITTLPSVGQVVGQGRVLYRVDDEPVVLLSGSTPAYRALAVGATAAAVTGSDVAELNHDLVTLGYVHKLDVDSAWDEFSWATKAGIKKLQAHLGYATADQSGALTLGQVVFLPTAARVTGLQASLGGPAAGPILTATSTTRKVSLNLDVTLQSQVKRGDRVSITLPDSSTTPGTVASVGTVGTTPSPSGPGGPSTPTVAVEITPTNPAATGRLDQEPVQVAITTATVRDTLAAPVDALLALATGGYAVEEIATDGVHHLVPVSLGIFDDADGLAQVSGSGLAAGQRVVVPGS